MSRKTKLVGVGSLVTLIVVILALIIGLCVCYAVLKDHHYINSPGDWLLLPGAYRGVFCKSYTVTASTNPVIGTNTVPAFDLYQGVEENATLSGGVTDILDGSNPIGDTSDTRMVSQSFHLTNGSRVRGSLCGTYFGKGKAPGIFVAVARSKDDLSNDNNSCANCIYSKFFKNVKCEKAEAEALDCPWHTTTTQKPPIGKHKYSVRANETGDYVFGYFYPKSEKHMNQTLEDSPSDQPNWMQLEREYFVDRVGYDTTTWKQISSRKLQAQVDNFHNADSLLIHFKHGYSAPRTRNLPYADILVTYRCNPTIWLYFLVFFVIPLLVIAVMWAVVYVLLRREQTGSGLLAAEDK